MPSLAKDKIPVLFVFFEALRGWSGAPVAKLPEAVQHPVQSHVVGAMKTECRESREYCTLQNATN